ncbi:hypothetical protein ACP70R_007500 [Stipagrostis hirtigluma subsp. patula]
MAAGAANAVRDGQTALALRLARRLAPSPSDAAARAGNVAVSPVAVHAALALVAAGARGATRDQLLGFLGAPSAADLDAFVARLVGRLLDGRCGFDGLRVFGGGGVWADASLGDLTGAFRHAAAGYYRFDARAVSFTEEPEAAAAMINQWVKKTTKNLIDGIISTGDIDVGASTSVVVASAVSFMGEWRHPFRPDDTWPGTFHRLDGGNAKASFMWMLASLDVACLDGFKVLRLPYKGGMWMSRWNLMDNTRFSMLVFLPDARDGVAAMADAVTAAPASLRGVLAQMTEKTVNLKLPKFEIAFGWDGLEGDLRRLGLSLPFSPEAAELGGMCEGGDDGDDGGSPPRRAFLSKVAHKAVVKVNETGSEVKAKDIPWSGRRFPEEDMVDFFADHPFSFLIMEEPTGLIVFAGHVVDPSK